ncbi:hypothetical protein IE53DRAFT_390949 [Violaceomyces palustris]|uniref:Uncharacterized protein n=1 Tax=Violaceomyces palustris TaxID=1673888 RepID=A0ACD0NMA7_9BASI|nr:hypothetical protein IE53DRAFT_390949 [Violaceomyces palustris]
MPTTAFQPASSFDNLFHSPAPRRSPSPQSNSPTDYSAYTPSPDDSPNTSNSQYKTATATLSAAFASLWGSYHSSPAAPSNNLDSSPSSLQTSPEVGKLSSPAVKTAGAKRSSKASSVNPAWPNLLSWGQGQGASSSGNGSRSGFESSSPPAPVANNFKRRSRAMIPFGLSSSPLEAHDQDAPGPSSSSPSFNADTSLRGLFHEDGSPGKRSYSPSRPRRGRLSPVKRNIPLSPPSDGSPNGSRASSPSIAYATLSRIKSKPSTSSLKGAKGNAGVAGPFSLGEAAQPIPASNWDEIIERTAKMDSYVRRIVFQAGLDYETRPMVVLAACCLPDPREVDYDFLLDRIMAVMDLFVENDYCIIYFAGGGKHRPGWSWIWKAYRRLGRKFRKNLKKLYIVHPTLFTRTLMQLINTGAYFVSPKFSKKVTQLYSLSDLAKLVPLTQIDVPPEVLQLNAKYEKCVIIPGQRDPAGGGTGAAPTSGTGVFGTSLSELMGERGEKGGIPRVVRDCVEAILGATDSPALNGASGPNPSPLDVEGLFRRSPSSALLKAAQDSYDRGHPVNLSHYRDPHIPAVLLKVFLRSLPEPIIPSTLYPLIRACPKPPPALSHDPSQEDGVEAQECISYIRDTILTALEPPSSLILLSYILELLHKVTLHADKNKMDAANLATVFAPNLVASGNVIRDVMICKVEGLGNMSEPNLTIKAASSKKEEGTTLGTVLRFCIERYYEIFDEIDYEPPMMDALSEQDLQGAAGLGLTSAEGLDPVSSPARMSTSLSNLSASLDDDSVAGDGYHSAFANIPVPRSRAGSASVALNPAERVPASPLRGGGARQGLAIHASSPGNTARIHASEFAQSLSRRSGGVQHRRKGSTASSSSSSVPASPMNLMFTSASNPRGTQTGDAAKQDHDPEASLGSDKDGFEIPAGSSNLAGSENAVGAENRSSPSLHTNKSISSRDGFRGPAGLSAVGRNSSAGSLRLTKGRLGSNANLRGAAGGGLGGGLKGGLAISALSAPAVSGGTADVRNGADLDGLTGGISGVALTGVSAAGQFTTTTATSTPADSPVHSPSVAAKQRSKGSKDADSGAEESEDRSADASPVSERSGFSSAKMRRGLSEVLEDGDEAA